VVLSDTAWYYQIPVNVLLLLLFVLLFFVIKGKRIIAKSNKTNNKLHVPLFYLEGNHVYWQKQWEE